MAASDSRPVPIKNTAYRAVFPLLDADGDLVTGAAGLDSEVSKDQGTFADCTNEATEIATSSGVYYLDLTGTEMNADCVAVTVKTSTSGAKTTVLVLYPQEAGDIKVDLETIKTQTVTCSGGVTVPAATLASTTNITAGTITTVTNLTNAPTAGDLTAAMKASVNAEVDTALSDYGALKPTTAGRTLDVTATGAAGIDWGNVENPTTVVGLSGTTVKTATDVEADTAAIESRVTTALPSVAPNGEGGLGTVNSSGGVPADVIAWNTAVLPDIDGVKAVTDKLDTALEADGASGYQFTTLALENGPAGGSAPTAAEVADAVWDEAQAGHTTAGTFGKYLDAAVSGVSTGGVSAADIADAVWDEARSGHATAGTFGETAGNLNARLPASGTLSVYAGADTAGTTTLLSRLTATRAGYIDNLSAGAAALEATAQTVSTRVTTALPGVAPGAEGGLYLMDGTGLIPADAQQISSSAPSTLFDAIWTAASRTLTALDEDGTSIDIDGTVRLAVGLASANLDTQLAALPAAADVVAALGTGSTLTALATAADLAAADAVADAIKLKTDQLTFTVAGQVDANAESVNGVALTGTGVSGDEWGPA